jgi:hypothetical protein
MKLIRPINSLFHLREKPLIRIFAFASYCKKLDFNETVRVLQSFINFKKAPDSIKREYYPVFT